MLMKKGSSLWDIRKQNYVIWMIVNNLVIIVK